MLKQIIAAALLSTALVAGAAAPAFANQDGGEDSTFWADRAAKMKSKAHKVQNTKKVKQKATRPVRRRAVDGRSMTIKLGHGKTRTVEQGPNNTRIITDRDENGQPTARRVVGRVPDHAINHTDGVMSVGVGGGVRVVIGPFGFSFSN